jgi:hypothetical protein
MNYQVFHSSARGENHKTPPEKECQDYSISYVDKTQAKAIVADGHGSDNCFRSAIGSKIAAIRAAAGIAEFIRTIEEERGGGIFGKKGNPPPQDDGEKKVQGLVKNIVVSWHMEVERHYKANHFKVEEIAGATEKYQKRYNAGEQLYRAYGTTLIAVAATEDYWFGIHIGDGKCTAFYPDGTWDQPIPWDDRCFLNETTSVCDEDAIEGARVYYRTRNEKEMPVMVFVNSDGVDDSYPAGNNEKYLAGLYRTIAFNFIDEIKKAGTAVGFESGVTQVKEFLPDLSKRGSHDDISIAALIDVEALMKLEPVFRQQIKDEEKEDADRKAAEADEAGQIPTQPEASPAEPEHPLKTADLGQYGGFVSDGIGKAPQGNHVDIKA